MDGYTFDQFCSGMGKEYYGSIILFNCGEVQYDNHTFITLSTSFDQLALIIVVGRFGVFVGFTYSD